MSDTLHAPTPRATVDESLVVHLHTLGAAAIRIGATRLGPGSARTFAALLFLAVERGRRISRATLHALLFPESSEVKGLHSVRQLLYKLRQLGAPVEGDGDSVALPERLVVDDYSDFLGGEIPDDLLERIAGGFLPGFAPAFSEAYTEWLEQYRSAVTLRIRKRLVEHIAQLRTSGNWDRLARVAKACLALDPLNEEATLALAEVLALSGSKAEAVQLLDKYIAEVGAGPQELRIPATVLRRRIAERLPEPVYRPVPLPPMVGRESEMAALLRLLRLAQSGQPQTVLVSGEPGIGKSRLVSEFAKVAALNGALVRSIALQPHDKRRPLAAFMDLIPQLRELPGALGCAPEALQLLDRLIATDAPGDMPMSGIFANVTRAIAELVDAVSSETPLMLTVEDGHWSDDMSVNTVASLMTAHRRCRVLIVITSRDQHLLSASPESLPISVLSISALDRHSAYVLLNHLVHPCDRDLADWIVRSGDGNPLFLLALASHYALTGQRFAVPPSVSEILAKRLDRLDIDAATVFDTCVLLGKHATIGRLQAVLEISALQLAGVLRRLEGDSLIVDVDGRIRSTHDLISEIAMDRVPHAASRLLHARIAKTLESEDTTKDDSVLWDAAEHWAAAGAADAAVVILERSADRAQVAYQVQRSTEFLKRAFDVVDDAEQKHRLAVRLIHSGARAEDWLRVQDAIQWLREKAGSGMEESKHDDFELIEYDAQYHLGRARAALVAALRRCLSSEEAAPEHKMHVARRLLTLADEAMDAESADDLRRIATRIPSYEGHEFDHLHFEMLYETLFGERARASDLAGTLVAEYPFNLSDRACIVAHNNAVLAFYRGGRVALAEDQAHRQYLLALEGSAPEPAFWAASIIAGISIDRGDLAQGHRWSELADDARMGTNFTHLRSGQLGNMLRLAILEKRPNDARAHLETLTRQYQASTTGRLRVVVISDSMRVRQLEGRPPNDDDDLAILLETHQAACRVGMHDDVAATIWYALDERGRTNEANAFLRHYLDNERRDLFPPAEEISQILRSERFVGSKNKSEYSRQRLRFRSG